MRACFFFVSVAALAAASGCMRADGPAGPQRGFSTETGSAKTATPLLSTSRISLEQLCMSTYDGVSMSPNGEYAVLDLGGMRRTSLVASSKNIAVVDLICAREQGSADACITYFQGLDGMRALAWTPDEQSLFTIENESTLVRLDFSKSHMGGVASIAERVPAGNEIAVTVTAVGPAAANDAQSEIAALETARLAALQGQNDAEIPVGVYVNAKQGLGAILLGPEDLSLTMLAAGERRALPLKSLRETSVARLAFNGRDATFVDVGIAIPGDASAANSSLRQPFSKPIIASSDGAIVGSFSRQAIHAGHPADGLAKLRQEVSARLAEDRTYFIQDVSTNGAGSFAYVLKNVFGRNKFGFVGHGAQVRHACTSVSETRACEQTARAIALVLKGAQYSCADADVSKTVAGARDIRVTQVSLGSEDWPLTAIRVSLPNARGLAVVFGGGPTGRSMLNLEGFSPVRNYLRMGWDVLAVNYSSSVGSGVEVVSRFRRKGSAAIGKDTQFVADYLLGNSAGNSTIVVYGESFGAMPAASLSGQLPLEHKLVLVAPFLRHQPPEAWVDKARDPFFSPRLTVESQKRAESALLNIVNGDDRALQAGLDGIYRQRADSTATYVAFARDDPLSQPDHLPVSWTRNVTTQVVPGGHDFVSVAPELWPAMQTWLNDAKVAQE